MSFKEDLEISEVYENEILATLQKSFPHAKKVEESEQDFFDLVIPKFKKQKEIRMEVKVDLYPSKNLAFEYLGPGAKSTGVLRTKANIWIHFRTERYLLWKMEKLKRYLLNCGCGYTRMVGDKHATTAWIIPEEKIFQECPPDLVMVRGGEEINNFLLNLNK